MLLSFVECMNLQPIYENGKPTVEKWRGREHYLPHLCPKIMATIILQKKNE
jgi:hypothetical protein